MSGPNPQSRDPLEAIGVVVIGRNEGDRLRACFESLPPDLKAVVYVDSGSLDGSVELARSKGITAIELDDSKGFTAARARTTGCDALLERHPELEAVQFVDGDCSIAPEWFATGLAELRARPEVGAVYGNRAEKFPEQSLYNRICEVEWRRRACGFVSAFGGDVMLRVEVWRSVGPYNGALVAGEDPEYAFRVCGAGWRIFRLDAAMTFHDANMHSFGEWWKRSVRSGYAISQVSILHGLWYSMDTKLRAWGWGVFVPLALIAAAPWTGGWSLAGFAVFPLRIIRTAWRARRDGFSGRSSLAWGLSCIVASFPHVVGMVSFHVERLRGKTPRLIEYK